jgi:hypothetical protein
VGIIAGKPSRNFTRPLGMPRGLKGLLHMLNAIERLIAYAKCNCFSHESEFMFLVFIVFSFFFLLRD